jgi:hypothetical protein
MALKITPRQKKICPDWPPQKLSLDCIVLQFSMTLTCGAQFSTAKVPLISEAMFYSDEERRFMYQNRPSKSYHLPFDQSVQMHI